MRNSHTLRALFEQTATWYPNHEAFVSADGDESTACTYAEADAIAERWAAAFESLGVGKGDRVAFLAKTTVEFALAYFGAIKRGAIPTPLHTTESRDLVERMVEQTNPIAVVFDPVFTEAAATIDDRTDVDQYVAFDRPGVDVPAFACNGATVRAEAPPTVNRPPLSASDPAFICFTSGSTGTPKGIVHTQSDAVECAHLGEYFFRARAGDTLIHLFTPSFIAWENATLPFMAVGARIVMQEEFDPEAVLDTIGEHSVSVLYTVPTQLKLLLEAGIDETDTDSVRLCGFGGETLNRETLRRIQASVTESLFVEYGTTEVMHSGTVLLPEDLNEETIDSVGRPIPGVDLRLVESGSNDPASTVDRGESGEIIIRGPSVATSVWEDPDRSADLFHEDGWWFSGDIGRVGDDGNLHVVGRVDSMFKTGGRKVYAEIVEDAIESHPNVVEAAVVGVPDETYGKVVTAHVIIGDASPTPEDLDKWCLDHNELADYQRPREYVFRESLPRTNTGKLDREPLREE